MLTTYKSYLAYDTFNKNNVPVYDGVLYEQRQIRSYMRYKDNFSIMERLNQVIYEFQGNPLSPGFSCVIALIHPIWFINDGDIVLRSFLAILLFSYVLFNYLKTRTSPINTLIIITLLFQLPLFYHFRYGLTSYIPEIPSALFLLAGFLQFLNFFKSEKILHFAAACLLMVTSIMFRFNFFVYAFFFFIPLLFESYRIIKSKSTRKIVYVLVFCFGVLSFLTFYIYSHLDSFLAYYASPYLSEKIPYAEWTLMKAINSFFFYIKEEVGFVGLIALLFILLISNQMKLVEKSIKSKVYLAYPFVFFFSFIILFLLSSNTPHIIAAMVVFMFSFFILPIQALSKLYNSIKINYLKGIAFVLIIVLNVNYVSSYHAFSQTLPEQLAHRKVVDFISNEQLRTPTYKYMCFYDEMVETQIDVAVYKKTGIWLSSQDHYYLHDMYLANISPDLNSDTCTKHYTDKIDAAMYDLVVINKNLNTPIKEFQTSTLVNSKIEKFMENNKKYFVVKRENTKYHGEILFFKKK